MSGPLTEIALSYQRALEKDEKNSKALLGMSLIALASGQNEASIRMARAAVAAAPTRNLAWVTLGQALKGVGRCDEAKQAYLEAIRLDGVNAVARMAPGGAAAGRGIS